MDKIGIPVTDDIVTRLRELPNKNYTEHGVVVSLEDCLKIADEIERLRAELTLWKKLWSGGQDEIDKLREELLNALKPNLNSLVDSRSREEFLHKRIDVMEKALKLECESKIHWFQKCNKWRDIAEGFAKAHRYRFGLDGAWDKEYTAYEQGLRDD